MQPKSENEITWALLDGGPANGNITMLIWVDPNSYLTYKTDKCTKIKDQHNKLWVIAPGTSVIDKQGTIWTWTNDGWDLYKNDIYEGLDEL